MGRFRNESTVEAFKQVYKTRGGGFRGVAAFWQGLTPKLVSAPLIRHPAARCGCRPHRRRVCV